MRSLLLSAALIALASSATHAQCANGRCAVPSRGYAPWTYQRDYRSLVPAGYSRPRATYYRLSYQPAPVIRRTPSR